MQLFARRNKITGYNLYVDKQNINDQKVLAHTDSEFC